MFVLSHSHGSARRFLIAVLAILVACTSVEMAVARGAPMPVGQQVICTGHGTVVVLVDAEGQPTRSAHLCPDTALGLFVDAGVPQGLVLAQLNSLPLRWHAIGAACGDTLAPAANARAPPVLS